MAIAGKKNTLTIIRIVLVIFQCIMIKTGSVLSFLVVIMRINCRIYGSGMGSIGS